MPKRTELILTASGLQASLNLGSANACLDSLLSVLDQYSQRYGRLPPHVHLSEQLPAGYAWLLADWLKKHDVGWSKHYGETPWLLVIRPDEVWRGDA